MGSLTDLSLAATLARSMAFDYAHRGLFTTHELPENSLAAARAALEAGFGIECDVRMSSDGVVYVFHDDDLQRMTGQKGLFESHSSKELATLCLDGVRGEGIPKLRDWLDTVRGHVPVVIELKSFDESGFFEAGRLEDGVWACLADYEGDALLKSFNPNSVERLFELRKASSERRKRPIGLLSAGLTRDSDFRFLSVEEAARLSVLELPFAGEADFVSYSVRDLTPELRFSPKWRDKPWMLWTVRTKELLDKTRLLKASAVFERGVLDFLGTSESAPEHQKTERGNARPS